ncbi:unnamed protein product [Allacma fusca]|uniref:Uncharacterized protein n=1 Tax=Allacma fusca TaxID=39272 RepID=A0A8J2JXG4_9HEXA|nr:unnamed protein product [Allacma fusca]
MQALARGANPPTLSKLAARQVTNWREVGMMKRLQHPKMMVTALLHCISTSGVLYTVHASKSSTRVPIPTLRCKYIWYSMDGWMNDKLVNTGHLHLICTSSKKSVSEWVGDEDGNVPWILLKEDGQDGHHVFGLRTLALICSKVPSSSKTSRNIGETKSLEIFQDSLIFVFVLVTFVFVFPILFGSPQGKFLSGKLKALRTSRGISVGAS